MKQTIEVCDPPIEGRFVISPICECREGFRWNYKYSFTHKNWTSHHGYDDEDYVTACAWSEAQERDEITKAIAAFQSKMIDDMHRCIDKDGWKSGDHTKELLYAVERCDWIAVANYAMMNDLD